MDALEYFRVGVALLYHEARHVRRFGWQSLQDPAAWGALRGLPDDRLQAWKCIRPLLVQAAKAPNVAAVQSVFEKYFRRNLADLEEVFRKAPWPGNVGGSKWAAAAATVRALGAALEAGDPARAESALEALKGARHNTGTLLEKYRRLESGR